MDIEPIPDDCLPPPDVIQEVLRGPRIGDDGKIVGGTWHGMTPDEVLAERDRFARMFGD